MRAVILRLVAVAATPVRRPSTTQRNVRRAVLVWFGLVSAGAGSGAQRHAPATEAVICFQIQARASGQPVPIGTRARRPRPRVPGDAAVEFQRASDRRLDDDPMARPARGRLARTCHHKPHANEQIFVETRVRA